ncbi:MAG: efflux RND transporter periplasmic adaptor subunit, partial [Candidatus Rokubacteria bacterium]|nr:efflux RND transporter periplasmic adaptor subunit [Candidatus Rokubacteria bacterium]
TVDSFAGQTFAGDVVQIRKAPQVIQNVVTYDVVVSAQNSELKLLPGMTANVRVVVEQKPSVLKVPNAALRFRPQGTDPDGGPRAGQGAQARSARGPAPDGLAGRVWIAGPEGKPQPVPIRLGITDGSFTELLEGDLREGQELIVGTTERPGPRPGGNSRSGPRFRL